MTTVPPPNSALPQVLAAAAASTGTISRPTPAVAALPPGATISGTVTPTPDPRVVMLATSAGDIPLRTPTPLPDGATLTVEVLRSSPAQVTVRLVSLDGQALQQALAQAARPQVTPPAVPSPAPPVPVALPVAPGTPTPLPQGFAWTPSGPQPVAALPPISAYVVAGSDPVIIGSPTTTPGPPLASGTTALLSIAGTELTVRVTSVVLPTAESVSVPGLGTSAAPAVAVARNESEPSAAVSTAGTALELDAVVAVKPTVTAPLPISPPPSAPVSGQAAIPEPLLTPSVQAAPTSPGSDPPLAETAVTPVPSPATPLSTPDDADEVPSQQPLDTSGLVLPNRAGWPVPAPTPPTTVVLTAPQATLTGTVVLSQDGIPVVQTMDGQIQLNVRANLPPGTVVTLEVSVRQQPTLGVTAPPAPVPAPALTPLSAGTAGWPTLTEAVQVLQRTDPAAATQLANAIPDGGPRTALALMAYVQALRSGEPRQWPGDTSLRALERAGPRGAHLAEQLAGEVGEISRQVRDTPGEWRALPLPWQAEGRIERVRMVVRDVDPEDDAKKKNGGGGTRFLVDLDLSRLGPLQLDGMFRKETRSFDMMIRTRAPLHDAMRRDLAGLFANSNAAMNLVGSLSFQVVKKFPDPVAAPETGKDKSGLWV